MHFNSILFSRFRIPSLYRVKTFAYSVLKGKRVEFQQRQGLQEMNRTFYLQKAGGIFFSHFALVCFSLVLFLINPILLVFISFQVSIMFSLFLLWGFLLFSVLLSYCSFCSPYIFLFPPVFCSFVVSQFLFFISFPEFFLFSSVFSCSALSFPVQLYVFLFSSMCSCYSCYIPVLCLLMSSCNVWLLKTHLYLFNNDLGSSSSKLTLYTYWFRAV